MKEDLDYETAAVTGGFQTKVTLHCLGGDQFVGECCPDESSSRNAAAKQAVEHNKETIEALTKAGVTVESIQRDCDQYAVDPNIEPRSKKARLTAENGTPKNVAALSNKNTLQGITHQLTKVRDMAKGTIQYTTNKVGDCFQSTCSIPTLGGPYEAGFEGDICTDSRAAEQSAAGMVLANMESDESIQQRLAENQAHQAIKKQCNKQALHDLCQRIMQGYLNKGDIAYDTQITPEGFQCTINIPSLGPEYETVGFTGEVCSSEPDAEQSAAAYGVEAIKSDPNFQEALSASTAPKKDWRGGGKSKGKGKGKGKGESKGKAAGKGQWVSAETMENMMWMMAMMKGKGKGKGETGMAAMQGTPHIVPPPNQMYQAPSEEWWP